MTKRTLTLLGAAFAAAMLAAPAGANDRMRHSGGVMTPSSPNETVGRDVGRMGQAVVPDSTPTSPNESNPTLLRENRDPIARSDNPNLPNPVTPSGANESAPQPKTTVFDPTNQPGIPPRAPVGATR